MGGESPGTGRTTVVTSSSNPRLKLIRALRQRRQRDAQGLFVVEGIFHVAEALAANAVVEYLCYAPELLGGAFGSRLVADAISAGIPCVETTARILTDLAGKEHPQGLLAVVRQRRVQLSELAPDSLPWGVALVSPQDPGNVGAILRTIDAVGAAGLMLLDAGVDPYHPTAVRASMGALFWHPVVSTSFAEWAGWVAARGYAVYGTSAKASADYRDVETYRLPMILLMGSEREGLTPEQASVCDALVRMPMHGRVSSLNLAVATGVMLYAVLERLETGGTGLVARNRGAPGQT